MGTPLDDIRRQATEYWELVATRADAHERSAEWHRHKGAQLGVAATALSAVASTAIIATITRQLGLSKDGSITIPPNGWAWLILIVLTLLLILSPVLTAVQAYLNHPEQADKHRVSWAGYYRVQQRIDLFLLRYSGGNVTATDRQEALKDLEDISSEIGELCKNSITLTRDALGPAEIKVEELMAARSKDGTVQPPLSS